MGRRSENPKNNCTVQYVKTKETRQHTRRMHKIIYRDLQNFTSRIHKCRSKFPPLELRFLYNLKSNSSYMTLNTLDYNDDQNTKNLTINKTYRSVPEKIRTKLYGRKDEDRRDEPDTTTPVVGK